MFISIVTVAYPLFPGNLLAQEATDREVAFGFDFVIGSGGIMETTIRDNINSPARFS